MKALELKKVFNRFVLVFLFCVCILAPPVAWGSGYQENKLFDGDFYTSEDLQKKIELHTKEIEILQKDIKALETDIDWLVLKINQIEDSGRPASPKLKEAISNKEKKIATLQKTKDRLEYLVQYYSSGLKTDTRKASDNNWGSYNIPSSVEKYSKPKIKKAVPKARKKAYLRDSMYSSPMEGGKEQYGRLNKNEVQAAINKAGLNDWVELSGAGTCLRLKTTLPILFPTGSAKVAKEYKIFFKKLSTFLKPYDVKVLVNGYADKVPIKTKKYPSNFELGATRAANIVHQMVYYGLKPSIFRIESTGKYRFAAKNPSQQKSLERRAEVTVIFSG